MLRKKPTADLLFAANLPLTFSNDNLAALFDSFGIVIASRLAVDPETGHSRGFGFVELATERARMEAIAGLNGKRIDGRKIEVKLADQPAHQAKRLPQSANQPVSAMTSEKPVMVEYRRRFSRETNAVLSRFRAGN